MNPTSPKLGHPAHPEEVRGWLKIDGERKTGAYGAYWNVTITPVSGQPPVQATLSEKTWTKSGFGEPSPAMRVDAVAHRNPSGRWNIIDIDTGLKNLNGIPATIVCRDVLDRAGASGPDRQPATVHDSGSDAFVYRFRLSGTTPGSPLIETCVSAAVLEKFGIHELPPNCTLLSDWSRTPRGWKLERFDDVSLRAFFGVQTEASPVALGRFFRLWRFDDGSQYVKAGFQTKVAGLSIACRIYADTLRSAGLRSVAVDDPVRARLFLRDGSWRVSELLEPRPDLRAQSKGEIIFAVQTRFAFREQNERGEVLNWLEIQDRRIDIGVARLGQTKLLDIDEGEIALGAYILCDLRKGNRGWYASRIHRITD